MLQKEMPWVKELLAKHYFLITMCDVVDKTGPTPSFFRLFGFDQLFNHAV